MKKIKLVEDILVQNVDNEAVVVSPTVGMITTVNETAAFLLQYIKEKQEVVFEDLVNVLLNEYDASLDLITKDVESFIEEMKNNKIVE